MKKDFLCLTVLFLSSAIVCACSPTATVQPEPETSPTLTASATITISTSATPEPPTATVIETPPIPTPTDQGDCTNRAEFVSDVTIPDYTNIKPGDKFTKIWRIHNIGSCTWNMRYSLVFIKGTQMSNLNSAPFPETKFGDTLDVSIDMIAPVQDGNFTGSYQIQGPVPEHRFAMKDGNIWVRIVVGSGTAVPFTPTNAPQVSVTPTSTSLTPSITGMGQGSSCNYLANPDFTAQVMVLINQARTDNGLQPFTLNNQLASAAQKHSIDMGCNNFLAHTGSDGSSAKSRVVAEGYSASRLQEAIYAEPPQFGGTPQSAVNWWLNDAQHRPILLSSQLTEIGVGYVSVSTSDLGGYFTVDLATP